MGSGSAYPFSPGLPQLRVKWKGTALCYRKGQITFLSRTLSRTLSSGLCIDSHLLLSTAFSNSDITFAAPWKTLMRATERPVTFPRPHSLFVVKTKFTFRQFNPRSSDY